MPRSDSTDSTKPPSKDPIVTGITRDSLRRVYLFHLAGFLEGLAADKLTLQQRLHIPELLMLASLRSVKASASRGALDRQHLLELQIELLYAEVSQDSCGPERAWTRLALCAWLSERVEFAPVIPVASSSVLVPAMHEDMNDDCKNPELPQESLFVLDKYKLLSEQALCAVNTLHASIKLGSQHSPPRHTGLYSSSSTCLSESLRNDSLRDATGSTNTSDPMSCASSSSANKIVSASSPSCSTLVQSSVMSRKTSTPALKRSSASVKRDSHTTTPTRSPSQPPVKRARKNEVLAKPCKSELQYPVRFFDLPVEWKSLVERSLPSSASSDVNGNEEMLRARFVVTANEKARLFAWLTIGSIDRALWTMAFRAVQSLLARISPPQISVLASVFSETHAPEWFDRLSTHVQAAFETIC
jgi:hypothetical protein